MATLTDNACDLEIIESLDFDIEIPCEHSQHETGMFGHTGPAYYLIRTHIPCGCDDDGPEFIYICKGGYEDTGPIRCWVCDELFPRSACWTVISKVRN